jgi:hypothetical protein
MAIEREDILFTKTNPVRERRTYAPNLALENFELSASDLDTVFDAAKVIRSSTVYLERNY